jgi:hypothetical protein
VFELLKRHLYLEVSARAKIDLYDYVFGSQNRYYQDIPVAVSGFRGRYVSCISQPLVRGGIISYQVNALRLLRQSR